MSSIQEWVIHSRDSGKRLDVAIADLGQGITRSQAKNLVVAGHVRIDGKTITKVSVIVTQGQTVTVAVPTPVKLDLSPQEVGIRILYEDDALAVLEKPCGLSVHPSETDRGPTVVHGLLHSLKTLSSVGGIERPGIVHRIDKGTSGVLVVSKTDSAHLDLSAQFKAHTIERRYLALAYGDLQNKLGKTSARIETFFGRHPTQRKKMTGKLTSGRKAITHWKVLERLGPLSLVECKLETGRTHQIRVHLAEMGFPIVGDPLYIDNPRKAKALSEKHKELGAACAALDHQLLHAAVLGFIHPASKESVRFESEPPVDFQNVLKIARSGVAP